MTHMLTRAKALPGRFLHGGAAGDAGSVGGRRIASNVVVQLLAQVITMAFSVITVSLTARTLARDGFGVWSASSSYTGLFGVLTDLGLTIVALQRMASEPEREGEWLGALVAARTGLSLLAAAICAASVPLFLSNPHHTHAVVLILTFTIPSAGAGALMSVFQARLRAGLALALTVLQSALWLTAVILLANAHASVVAFAVVYTVLIASMALVQIRVTARYAHIAWRAGLRLLRPLLKVAIPLGVASVMIRIYYQIDSVLLLQISGPSEAGIYGAAYGFLGPLTFLPGAILGSFFPVLSAVYERDPQRARRLVQICADSMAVISLPILAGTIALSGPIVHLLFGAAFQRSAGVLPILMLAFVSICFGTLAGFLAPLLNRQWRLALYSSIGAVANVALNLVLIPPYGAHGSAWATVVTEVLTMVLMLGTSLRTLQLRLVPWRMLRTVALAAAMTGVMILLRPWGLLPAGAIGVLFYVVGLFVVRVVDRDELRAIRAQPSD